MATSREEIAAHDTVRRATMRWRVRLLVASCVVAMFALYWPTSLALFELWTDTDKTTFTHGFIVLAVTFWLILRDERLERVQIEGPRLLIFLAYVVCALGWLVALRAGIDLAHEIAFPLLIWLATFALFGSRVAWLCTFPIAFLVFAVPIWDVLTSGLQTVTAWMVGNMLHLSGISAYVDGNFVRISVGTFEIAGGCSGLHFVMVGLALGALYGELGRDSTKTRAALVLLAFALAVAANWVRVYVIVVAGYLTNMQHYLVRVEHYRFGWAVFAVTMALFFWIARRFPGGAEDGSDAASIDNCTAQSRGPHYAIVAIGLLAIPLWSTLSPVRQADLGALPRSLVPLNDGWSGSLQQETTWRPSFAGADSETLATYERAGTDPVEVFIASYRLQRQDKELVGYRSHLVTEPERIVTTSRVSSSVTEAVVAGAAGRDLVRYSYLIGDWATSNGFFAQLAYGVKSLWSAPLSRIVALRTRCDSDDCADARRRLEQFELLLQPPRMQSH